jgi:hypothetical protein
MISASAEDFWYFTFITFGQADLGSIDGDVPVFEGGLRVVIIR